MSDHCSTQTLDWAQSATQSRVSYIDTVQIYTARTIEDEEKAFLRSHSFGYKPLGVMPFQEEVWVDGIQLDHADREAFEFFEQRSLDHIITRVDPALDLCTQSYDAAVQLGKFVVSHLLYPRHPPAESVLRFKSTYYWRRPESSTGLVVYSDQLSKPTGLHCTHVEWRIKGSNAVRDAGIKTAADVLDFDPVGFLRKRLKLSQLPEKARFEVIGGEITSGGLYRPLLDTERFGEASEQFFESARARFGQPNPQFRDEHSVREWITQDFWDICDPEYRTYFCDLPIDWIFPE